MKTLNKKLQLNKETIARLNKDQESSIYGGQIPTYTCPPETSDCGDTGLFDTRVVCLSIRCESSDTQYSCVAPVCIPLTDGNGCKCPTC